jgi:hypothetical protein
VAEVVPLPLLTSLSLKKCHLFLRFHALSYDPYVQASSHADDRAHNHCIVGGDADLTDERQGYELT